MQTRTLPLFPLGLVLFPDAPLPLHIFEPRYRTMVASCLAADRRFGVILARTDDNGSSPPELASVGTVAEIIEARPLSDGRYEILCVGRERFTIVSTSNTEPYLQADVLILPEPELDTGSDTPTSLTELRRELREGFIEVLTRTASSATMDDARREQLVRIRRNIPREAIALTYFIGRLLPSADTDERQAILEERSAANRLRKLIGAMPMEIMIARQIETSTLQTAVEGVGPIVTN